MSANSNSSIKLSGEIIRETDKAVQFKFLDEDDIERLEWFPISQIDSIHRTEPAVINVSAWIYGKKQESWGA